MGFNSTWCEYTYRHNLNDTERAAYNYTGHVFHRLDTNREPAVISFTGCEQLCGSGHYLYAWADISQTVTTWILPMSGLILQAPFESNQFWKTIRAICRWIGSPILALAYILWNIKVTGECAYIVDLATGFDDIPTQDSSTDFSDIRDSFYTLSVMNQYIVNRSLPSKEAEMLLRAALFRDDMEVKGKPIGQVRRKLAARIRNGRKKGVVPIFISQFWFTFSLGLSVQQAFDKIGDNATAHNLAMGLLLGWLPVLILCSIVDRNPASTDDIERRLNHLVELVRAELTAKVLDYDSKWVLEINSQSPFFIGYGGQGRVRWHYGIAHGILQALKDDLIHNVGRGWIYHPKHREYLIKRPNETSNLYWFDLREGWQILHGLLVVGLAVFGAFYISYFTPTVGLGCRSGGYLVFIIIAFSMMIIEMTVWCFTHRLSPARKYFRLLLRLMELVNFGWLMYILLAQTFGLYRSCRCMSSMWGRIGGYIDWNYFVNYSGYDVRLRWATGTAMGLSMISFATVYIVTQWMMQSHIWSEDYDKAMRGLKRTRKTRKVLHVVSVRWSKLTSWVESIFDRMRGKIPVLRGVKRTATVEIELGTKRTNSMYSNYDQLASSTSVG